MELSERQQNILKLVRNQGPITSEHIAEELAVPRATLRSDLTVLTLAGYLGSKPRVGYFISNDEGLMTQAARQMQVSDFMSVPVVVQETSSVYDAIVMMFMEDVGTIFVMKGGLLTGVVSRKDLLKIMVSGREAKELPVNLAMTRVPQVVTVTPMDGLLYAANRMIEHEVDSLPVVRGGDAADALQVVGRVSKTTITRAFVELGRR